VILETERLILRPWRDEDRAPYAAMVGDPYVRRFYLVTMNREQADAAIDTYIEYLQRDGFGLLAVERKSDGAFIGDVGLVPVVMPIRGNPPVEIGWLLGQQYWGNGYAVEAARAWIDVAFNKLALPEIVAWTAVSNLPSQRVMQKLGMTHDPADDFLHPKVPEGHPLRPHVLYRLKRPSGAA
jgi:RimJ/RimL family protein N-acetyltransferase